MVKIGKIYELHFGQNIFIKYKVSNINYDTDQVQLIKIEDYYMAAEEFVNISIQKLYKKRKIRDW